MGHRVVTAAALAVALFLLAASAADASVRYAAPGGQGLDPCVASAPCPLYLAAGRNNGSASTIKPGDKVVLAPGLYQEEAGDLSDAHTVWIKPGVTVEGAGGPFKSVISLHSSAGYYGAFVVEGEGVEGHDTVLRNVDIESATTHSDLTLVSGVVEGVVARSTAGGVYAPIVCEIYGGVLRDSACITEGSEASAVGVMTANQAEAHKIGEEFHLGPQLNLVLRNVTAIGAGPKTRGLGFKLERETGTVDAKNVLAEGTEFDALAIAEDNASLTIDFDHSAFDPAHTGTKTTTGGTASVAGAGTNGNVAAAPLLAGDHVHQLAASPTVDAGAADPESGTVDVDGEQRTIGAAPDIGADELGLETASAMQCVPPTLVIGEMPSSDCTVTVTNVTGGSAPTGTVAFATPSYGLFTPAECALAPTGPSESSCDVTYQPVSVASSEETHHLFASYLGDLTHDRSATTAIVSLVNPPQQPAGAPAGGGGAAPRPPAVAPNTKLLRRPPRRTHRRVASFAFDSTPSASAFECRLDGQRFHSCSSPLRLRGLAAGWHRFQVRGLGADGLLDPTPASYRWRVLRRQ